MDLEGGRGDYRVLNLNDLGNINTSEIGDTGWRKEEWGREQFI